MKLTEGDRLIIPKGWTVEFAGNAMSIHHKHYMAGSRRSYAWFEFINEAHKQSLQSSEPGCDAPVGWIRPERYSAACESKMEFFKQLKEARQIITELVAFCQQPDIVAATDGAFDPDATIQAAKRFLSGGDSNV